MKKRAFKLPMRKSEKILGWIWLPFHIFLLSLLLNLAIIYIFPAFNLEMTTAQLNLMYYTISFAYVLIFMFHYLRESFYDLWENPWGSIKTIILGYFIYYIMIYAVSLLLSLLLDNLTNPNSSVIIHEAKLNKNVMIVVSVLLAPVVEETLFRGVVFGTIRQKHRILAYIVSIALFSIYHLWEYFLGGFSWTLFLYLLQYLPGGIILAWAYESSGNLWTSVFLHMLINGVSMYATLNF